MIKYRILPEKRLIFFCNWGSTSLKEIDELRKALQNDPEYSLEYDALLDNTHLERQYTSEEIHELSRSRNNADMPHIKLAIIAPGNVTFGMSRMYQIITDEKSPVKISVCRDTKSALKWLDREGIDIESLSREIRERAE